jgi:hypothetical protein
VDQLVGLKGFFVFLQLLDVVNKAGLCKLLLLLPLNNFARILS